MIELDAIMRETDNLPDLVPANNVPFYSTTALDNLNAKGEGIQSWIKLNGMVYYEKEDIIEWLISRAEKVMI